MCLIWTLLEKAPVIILRLYAKWSSLICLSGIQAP